jgi:hypothetical protein
MKRSRLAGTVALVSFALMAATAFGQRIWVGNGFDRGAINESSNWVIG